MSSLFLFLLFMRAVYNSSTRLWTRSGWVAASVVAAAAGGTGARVLVGWGVLVCVGAWVRAVSLRLLSLLLWFCWLRGVVLVEVLLLLV